MANHTPVATPAKKTPDVSADIFGTVLTLNFSNGAILEVDASKLAPEIQARALIEGLKKKLVDGAALACSTASGRSASIEDKYEGVKEIYDRLTAAIPAWNKGKGEGAGATAGLFLRAMMQVMGKGKPEVETIIAGLTKEQLAAMKKNPRIVKVMDELRPAANADESNALLDLLMLGGVEEEGEAAIEN
jgi:hypothetical protein